MLKLLLAFRTLTLKSYLRSVRKILARRVSSGYSKAIFLTSTILPFKKVVSRDPDLSYSITLPLLLKRMSKPIGDVKKLTMKTSNDIIQETQRFNLARKIVVLWCGMVPKRCREMWWSTRRPSGKKTPEECQNKHWKFRRSANSGWLDNERTEIDFVTC